MRKERIKILIIGIVIGMIIMGTSVYATILYQSSEVGYDNSTSGLSSTDVQAALDELYNNYYGGSQSISGFSEGDYFTLVPDKNNYTIDSSITGYDTDQTINPSELDLWRVIKINGDGSIDAISEYTSSEKVFFKGVRGYANYVGGLQTIAAQYEKTGYTKSTRMFGYAGQTLTISDTSLFDGSNSSVPTTATPDAELGNEQEYEGGALGDTLYLTDWLLVIDAYGFTTGYVKGVSTAVAYHMASRQYDCAHYTFNQGSGFFLMRGVNSSGATIADGAGSQLSCSSISGCKWETEEKIGRYVRPIITLKSEITISNGSGTKKDPYQLN